MRCSVRLTGVGHTTRSESAHARASMSGGWKKPFAILCVMLAAAAFMMRMWYVDLKKKHLL